MLLLCEGFTSKNIIIFPSWSSTTVQDWLFKCNLGIRVVRYSGRWSGIHPSQPVWSNAACLCRCGLAGSLPEKLQEKLASVLQRCADGSTDGNKRATFITIKHSEVFIIFFMIDYILRDICVPIYDIYCPLDIQGKPFPLLQFNVINFVLLYSESAVFSLIL